MAVNQYYIGDIPLAIWPDVAKWMIAVWEPGSWDIIDDDTIETTEENVTLLYLKWL